MAKTQLLKTENVFIRDADSVAAIEKMKPIFGEKTASKIARRLILAGTAAINGAMAEPDIAKRKKLLDSLGIELVVALG